MVGQAQPLRAGPAARVRDMRPPTARPGVPRRLPRLLPEVRPDGVKIAVGLPQVGDDVQACVRAARDAEDAGAWGVWVYDNLGPLLRPERPSLEGWALIGPLARATSRVKLVSLVTRAGMRHPALVARMAAVAQDASNGRFVLGLGAGDRASRAEERRFGIDMPGSRAWRLEQVEETARRVRGDELPVRPNVDAPPIWIGGHAAEILDCAARVADAWHGWGAEPDVFARKAERLTIDCWWGGMFEPGQADRQIEALERAGATGVTWMIASTHDAEYRPLLLDLVRASS